MVKLGVFLLARLWPVLSGTQLWFWLVGSAGLVTLLLGAWAALFQRDLKGLLAYSTISHLGLIVLLLGLNSPLAAVAAVFHIMNHATFKASLFMAVGIIDHETGTRDIRRLSGLFRLMPITGTLALVATAAMAGVPLLNGFLSKEMFFAETVFVDAMPAVQWGLPMAATLAGMGSVAYSLRFAAGVFFGPASARDTPRVPRSRRTGCGCRSRCWCSRAWWWASRPPRRSGRCSTPPSRPVVGGRCRRTASSSGTASRPAADERARAGRRRRAVLVRRRLEAGGRGSAGAPGRFDGAGSSRRAGAATSLQPLDSVAGCSPRGSSAS